MCAAKTTSNANSLSKAKAEAKAEAKAIVEQQRFDTARKLKAMNVMTLEQIAEVTGLTPEQISAL
jgi:membrane-bound lytic murein transglycosylase B